MLKKILYWPRVPLLLLIRLYQKTLSPDHGPLKMFFPHGYCRFHPTCSEYGFRAIEHYGLIKGVPMTIWRVLRCNPWSKGGYDDPIKQQKND
jgi:uncharacterized protein